MARTTVDIDAPVLRDLKSLQKREKKTLGRLISDLLAEALNRHRSQAAAPPPFRWATRAMQSRVDLTDKEAVRATLDHDTSAR